VLATVVAAKEPREGVDFLPLTVDYQEKFYAAGRIPGGYFKREGRPTEKETLVSRLIDRPVRPLFAPGWRNETQVIVTTLSHDLENDPDVLAMIASSAALTLSGAPFMGPIGAARVGFVNNEYVLNPLLDEMAESQLDLVVAGTQDAVLMVESEAKELSEDVMLGAGMFGHRHFQPVIDAIIKLAEKAAKEPRELQVADNTALEKEMLALIEADLRAAYADKIDGAWCNPTGRIDIDGPKITVSGKNTFEGDYRRHQFFYTVPQGEDHAGDQIYLQLLNDENMTSYTVKDGMNVDPVDQRAGEPGLVPADGGGRALADVVRHAEAPAGAGVGSEDHQELRRKPHDTGAARDHDMARLQGLPQGIENKTAELGCFIQKKNTPVRERHRAGPGKALAATDEGLHRRRMVRRAVRRDLHPKIHPAAERRTAWSGTRVR